MTARQQQRSPLRDGGSAEVEERVRQLERRLREAQARYEVIMGAITESVFDWDIAHGRVSYSESTQRTTGLPAEVLHTFEDWRDRIHPDDFSRYHAALAEHLEGSAPRFECDHRYRTLDGSWRWARQQGVAQRDSQGRAVRMTGSTRDITELKEHELELAEQRAILETTLENIDQGITMVDKDLHTIALNRRFLELLDLPAERFARGFHMEEAFRFNAERGEYGPGDVEELVRHRVELSRRFEPHAFERARPDGSIIAVRGKPLPGGGFVSTYSDVTEQRRTEEGLRKSEERYALATSAAAEGIYEWSVDTGALFLTERAKAFFSLAGEELTSRAWNSRVHPQDMAGYRNAIVDHFKGRTEHLEHEYRVADARGEYRWVLDRGIGVRDASGHITKVVGALSDITQRKRVEMELRRARDQAEEALEQQKAASEILQVNSGSIADTAPVFDKITESCERLFSGRIVGLNLVGPDGLIHIGAYHGEGRAELERIFPLPVTPGSGSGLAIVERRIVHYPDTDSDSVPPPTRQGCKAIGIKSAIFAPMLWKGRGIGAIFVGRDYVSSFSENEAALLKTFADQAAIAIENVRLFNEIQDKSRQLEIANRHKSQFLANMSHELRTPLNAIIGFTRIVMRRSQAQIEPKQYENLEKILMSGQNLLTLINAILDLAKVEAGRVEVTPGETDPVRVLEQCMRIVEPLIKDDEVRLVRALDAALPQMYVDEEKLRQIVINLLSNAAKFTTRGSIEVRARAADGWVHISVSDTGMGIAADKLELVFDEFQQADASSTRVHGGTGLGLTIARRLARLMGGDLRAQSTPGVGSTFTLTLPTRYGLVRE
jgi:PAS domain S-box-containing protein